MNPNWFVDAVDVKFSNTDATYCGPGIVPSKVSSLFQKLAFRVNLTCYADRFAVFDVEAFASGLEKLLNEHCADVRILPVALPAPPSQTENTSD